MEFSFLSQKISLEIWIAFIALLISVVSLGASILFWRRSFRPIVTAAVKTHAAGNNGIAYDLVLLNSGIIPARNLVIRADTAAFASALGGDATPENKKRWLVCFDEKTNISILHNGDRISCSFGTTKINDSGFWKYKSTITFVIKYEGWFGSSYEEPQKLQIIDSESFTGFGWAQ